MTIDPKVTEPANIYKVMVGSIIPRPIAFVSTISREGILNLAPFSFFTGASANPPVVCFSPMRNVDGVRKDTVANIEANGEFVVNIVSEEFVEKLNITAAEFPPEVDEFEASGLTPLASDLISVPRVKEAHVTMECRLLQIVTFSDRPLGGNLVIGEVILFHVDDAYINNYRIDPDKLGSVGRLAGSTYVRTTDRFDLARPVGKGSRGLGH
jgi:flavin reductase (DIM6/NTAB) family NADH-FMN oxidoreductase RutF